MANKYGIIYQGSKSSIAEEILSVLPSGKRFVDLFGGGFAMSHAALLSGKYKSVLYNDINPLVVQLVMDAISGKYNPERFTPRWVGREEFELRKYDDGYVKYIWSFSHNGYNYIFGKDVEPYKKLAFEMLTAPTLHDRRLGYKRFVKSLQSLQSLERLESLQSLERLESLQSTSVDYREIEHRDGDVVYCDIPYERVSDTQKDHQYGRSFDHQEFYEWARTRDYPVYFSSFTISANDFAVIWQKLKTGHFSATNNAYKQHEHLYWNGVKNV